MEDSGHGLVFRERKSWKTLDVTFGGVFTKRYATIDP